MRKRKFVVLGGLLLLVVLTLSRAVSFVGGESDPTIWRSKVGSCTIEQWETPCRNGVKLFGTTCLPDPGAEGSPCAQVGCVQMSYQTSCRDKVYPLLFFRWFDL